MGVELGPSYENMLSFSPNLGLKAMRRSRTLITRVLSPSYDQVMKFNLISRPNLQYKTRGENRRVTDHYIFQLREDSNIYSTFIF